MRTRLLSFLPLLLVIAQVSESAQINAARSRSPAAAEWQKYHSRYHTSSRELAQLATKARPGLLVLYHQLFWDVTEEDLLKEVRAGYSGKVVSGHDLEVY
jgi:ribonuclease BN (tRNA processing enzyme)